MPLLDHFHSPLAPRRHWESFHVNWAGTIADALNENLLPEGYFAEEHVHIGARVEIDVATFDGARASSESAGPAISTLPPRVWTPPAPAITIPATFSDSFEVLVFDDEGDARLVAAIELVTPANKDREAHRRAFSIKCASYLSQGISAVVVDIVTSREANVHDEIMRLLDPDGSSPVPFPSTLYAVAYRPIVRDSLDQIDVWPALLAVGQPLPVLPLALNAELILPLDLEVTYTAACERRRLG
jgi:hypothetical protein